MQGNFPSWKDAAVGLAFVKPRPISHILFLIHKSQFTEQIYTYIPARFSYLRETGGGTVAEDPCLTGDSSHLPGLSLAGDTVLTSSRAQIPSLAKLQRKAVGTKVWKSGTQRRQHAMNH